MCWATARCLKRPKLEARGEPVGSAPKNCLGLPNPLSVKFFLGVGCGLYYSFFKVLLGGGVGKELRYSVREGK